MDGFNPIGSIVQWNLRIGIPWSLNQIWKADEVDTVYFNNPYPGRASLVFNCRKE